MPARLKTPRQRSKDGSTIPQLPLHAEEAADVEVKAGQRAEAHPWIVVGVVLLCCCLTFAITVGVMLDNGNDQGNDDCSASCANNR